MARQKLPNWKQYWDNFNDSEILRAKAENIDETLQLIEKEFGTKLISGDQIMVISALDDRIEELAKEKNNPSGVVQADLFDDM